MHNADQVAKNFDGYIAEIDYTFGYYRHLAPTFLRLATLNQAAPFPSRRSLRYLELGCGNGISLNIHAAASPGEYWGTDVNPTHIDYAKDLAGSSGANLCLLDLSFADLLDRNDLPEFDVIVAHGVWSWVSNKNRGLIVELLRRKLAAGGVFYVSYNALPGCAGVIPLQQLLQLHSKKISYDKIILDRLKAGFDFATKLRSAGSKFFSQMPMADEWLEEIHTKNPIYLCHEYLQEHWRPFSFSEIAAMLSEADLKFVASADLLDHYDDLTVGAKGLALLESVKDPWMRETARDLLRNQNFRKDIFIKGQASLDGAAKIELLSATSFVLLRPIDDVPSLLSRDAATIDLANGPYREILKALAKDNYRSKPMMELSKEPALRDIDLNDIVRALVILTGAGFTHPVQESWLADKAKGPCRQLNEEFFMRAREANSIKAVASPIAGCGIMLPRIEQLFMMAQTSGLEGPSEWSSFVWHILSKENKGSENALEGAQLLRQAVLFSVYLPIAKALGLARIIPKT